MTKHPSLFAALAAPFSPSELKLRTHAGKQIRYITARTAMNRLDNVLGPENWFDTYAPGENSVQCALTIRLPNGEMLTKCDAGGYAGMADSGDDDKSGYSDAFKRAAVKFGVGRYLYGDGIPGFAAGEHGPGALNGKTQPAPPTPDSRLPTPPAAKPQGKWGNPQPAAEETHAPDNRRRSGYDGPETGQQLFQWIKTQEREHDIVLVKYLTSWGQLQQFPARIIDWDRNQVSLGLAEANRKLATLETQEVA